LADSTAMLKRVATSIAIVLSALAVILAVVFLVAVVIGYFTLLAVPPTAAAIAGILVVAAYPPAERTAWRFALWMFIALLSALIPIAYLAVRIAWRRQESGPLAARTPA
jgi:uncharacterized membrane protein